MAESLQRQQKGGTVEYQMSFTLSYFRSYNASENLNVLWSFFSDFMKEPQCAIPSLSENNHTVSKCKLVIES